MHRGFTGLGKELGFASRALHGLAKLLGRQEQLPLTARAGDDLGHE